MSDETASPSRIKITWLIGTLVAFALFAAIAAYSSRMTWDYTDYDQQRAIQRYDTLKKVRSTELSLITPVDGQGKPTAEWVDQTKGTVRIPIDEAMVEEIDVLKGKPAAIGAEIPPVVPPTPAKTAPDAGATNAAPAKPAAPAAKSAATPTNAAPAKPAAPAAKSAAASTNAAPATPSAPAAGPAAATAKPKQSNP